MKSSNFHGPPLLHLRRCRGPLCVIPTILSGCQGLHRAVAWRCAQPPSYWCAIRHCSSSSSTTNNGDSSTFNVATKVADPMLMRDSSQYRSHKDAERVACQQEDNAKPMEGLLAHTHDGSSCCECETGNALGALAPSAVSASGAPRPYRQDFGEVFHEQMAAWRASHLSATGTHTHASWAAGGHGTTSSNAHPSSSTIGGSGRGPEAQATAAPAGPNPVPPTFDPTSHGSSSDTHSHFGIRPEDGPPGMSVEAHRAHLEAEAEMQRFLAQNTIHSIRRSMVRDGSIPAPLPEKQIDGARLLSSNSALKTSLEPHHGYRGVQALLDYNKQWAAEVSRFNPRYFTELAKVQKPEYLWIGCSDSRVPANEIIGLHPGDVFVHRNIANIVSLSDLNCLSALQFAIDCLKVRHVIVAGHYKCGGVTAAMRGDQLGLTDHWIMQVVDIKNKYWDRVQSDIQESFHLSFLCEMNVLEQLNRVVNCRIVQRRWAALNATDRWHGGESRSVYVRPEYAANHLREDRLRNHLPADLDFGSEELEVHGWVYSLDDGMLRPLLSLTRHSNVKKEMADAVEALFVRYSHMS